MASVVMLGGADMRRMNDKIFLELQFRQANVSRQIVECLEQNFAVTRVKSRTPGADSWVLVAVDDFRQADAIRRLGRQHGFDVTVSRRAAA
jgi:hypothetical protein